MNLRVKYMDIDGDKVAFFEGVKMFSYDNDGKLTFIIDGDPLYITHTHWFYLYRDDEWASHIHSKEFEIEIEELKNEQ
jgi:hypothetical protein